MDTYMSMDETIAQLGGWGLGGALVYTGTKATGTVAASKENLGACVFQVNGRKGFKWFIYVILDFSDTYTVRLMQKRGHNVKILAKQTDVYCTEVKEVFESMYDDCINNFNDGFINI